jgi:hypothetical protein
MRITKQLAEQIAAKLLTEKQANVTKLRKEYEDYITLAYLSQTPKEVLAVYAKHPEWFYTRGSVTLNGSGFRYESVSTNCQVICNGGSSANLMMNDKISHKAKMLQNKWESAKDKVRELKMKLEVALFNLRTYAAVQKSFPEAAPFLPKDATMSLMINYDALRKELK